MRYRRKQKIPRFLYRHFDPYVFTFNLETETVSTLIITLDSLRAARVKKTGRVSFSSSSCFYFSSSQSQMVRTELITRDALRAARVKKRVGYPFIFLLFILHRSHKW